MTAKDDGNIVGSKALAKAFKLTPRRVQQLANDGVLTNHGNGRVFKFDWIEAVQQYLDHITAKLEDSEHASELVEAKKQQAEADLKRTRADQEAIKLAELECKMHRAEDVEVVLGSLVSFMRQSLVALPGRISVDAAAAHNAAEVSAIVKREVDALLTSLSGFGYNKADFAKLVRERRGWETDGEDAGAGDQ